MENKAEYIGDGIYANWDGMQLEVYTSNGKKVIDKIYFDLQTLESFLNYVERLKAGFNGGVHAR